MTQETKIITGVEQKKIDTAALVYDTLQEFKKPKYVAEELGWTMAKLRKTAKDYGIPLNIGTMRSDSVVVASEFDNKIKTFISEIVPDNLPDKIKEIMAKEETDDLLNYVVGSAVGFTISGFHVQVKNEKDAEKIKKFNTQYDMDAIIKRLTYYLVQTDSAALGWNNKYPNIDYVSALDPQMHKFFPKGTSIKGVPQFVAYRKNDKSGLKKALEALKVAAHKVWKPIDLNEKKWKQVNLNKEPIIIRTMKGHRDRMMVPSATSILPWLALRKQLADSYQVVAYYTKKMVQHIAVGDAEYGKKLGGILQDKSGKPPTKAECDAILADWTQKDDALTMVTGPHYKISFIIPEQTHLEGKSLTVPEKVIIRWAGLKATSSEDGNTYAGAYIELKPLKAAVVERRAILTRILEEFYRRALNIEDVDIMWNNLVLMETSKVLEIMEKFILKGGSIKTWMETFGFHADYELRIHRKELENPKDYWPAYEPSQGLLGEKKNGKNDKGAPKKPSKKPDQEDENTIERP